MTPAGLAWQLPRRPDVARELEAAMERYKARTGLTATTLAVAVGEIVEAGGLTCIESRAVARGCWLLGGGV